MCTLYSYVLADKSHSSKGRRSFRHWEFRQLRACFRPLVTYESLPRFLKSRDDPSREVK